MFDLKKLKDFCNYKEKSAILSVACHRDNKLIVTNGAHLLTIVLDTRADKDLLYDIESFKQVPDAGTYPKYEKLIPEESAYRISVKLSDFYKTVSIFNQIESDKEPKYKEALEIVNLDNKIYLRMGDWIKNTPLTCKGEFFDIAFRASNLFAFLKFLKGELSKKDFEEIEITLNFSERLRPITISFDKYFYLLMPIDKVKIKEKD